MNEVLGRNNRLRTFFKLLWCSRYTLSQKQQQLGEIFNGVFLWIPNLTINNLRHCIQFFTSKAILLLFLLSQ